MFWVWLYFLHLNIDFLLPLFFSSPSDLFYLLDEWCTFTFWFVYCLLLLLLQLGNYVSMNSVAQGQEISPDLCPVCLLLLNQKNSLLHVFFCCIPDLIVAKWTEYNLSLRKQTSCMLSVVTDNVAATWTVIIMEYISRPVYGASLHNSPEAYRCLLSSCKQAHTNTWAHTGTSNCIHTHVHPPPTTTPLYPHAQWIYVTVHFRIQAGLPSGLYLTGHFIIQAGLPSGLYPTVHFIIQAGLPSGLYLTVHSIIQAGLWGPFLRLCT